MELTYTKHGDYYIPDLDIPAQEKVLVNRYGRMHGNYLKKNNRAAYNELLFSGKLNRYLAELGEQAENILPSEKAFAYKMKMDAMKRKAGRPEKNSSQVATNFDTATEIGKRAGESRDQVFRYIRLTELIPDILQMVDDGKIALTPAVELSYLQDFEQEALFSIMECDEVTPSLSQAQRLRRMSEDQTFTDRTAMQVLSEVKGNQVEYVKVPVDSLRSYFRPDTSIKQMTETLVKAMEYYNRHLERQRSDRDAR